MRDDSRLRKAGPAICETGHLRHLGCDVRRLLFWFFDFEKDAALIAVVVTNQEEARAH